MNKLSAIRWTLLFIYFFPAFYINAQNQQGLKSLDLFLLMGQSNMAGYGALLPDDTKKIESVYILRDSVDKKEAYYWECASQPIHKRLRSDRFCLAGSFAKTYRELYPQSSVGLVPMAWGGSAISKMNKGTSFYQEVQSKILWAKKQGVLKAILWHQGESDTTSPEAASAYESKLTQLIQDLRTDLKEPDLLFIIGNLAEFYGMGQEHNASMRVENINQVRGALKNVSQKVAHVGYVESNGLRSIDRHQVHFDRNSYVILGNRYADVYEVLTNEKNGER